MKTPNPYPKLAYDSIKYSEDQIKVGASEVRCSGTFPSISKSKLAKYDDYEKTPNILKKKKYILNQEGPKYFY